MKKLLYKALFGYLYLLSLLPFWLHRGFANCLYFLVYYLFGYRKAVILGNLKQAFPEKSPKEIEKISKDFYLHLCDLMTESIKGVSMNQIDFQKHYKVLNWDILFDEHKKGNSVILISPHTGNWEWVFSLVDRLVHPVFDNVFAIYQPLQNPYFNDYVLETRQRYGAQLIPMRETYKYILEAHKTNKQVVSWFAADQSPSPENAYWTTFLHQDTAFHAGYARIATQTNQTIMFLDIKKVKRNFFELTLIPIDYKSVGNAENEGNPQKQQDFIVENFARLTEKRINENPAYWLWSHKRWKHKRNN